MSGIGSIQNIIEEIKAKIDIVDLVGSYVSLKKSGKYFKANCPFHQEKTPSFVVSPEIQRWQCFGACHEGGDIISFLMKWENIPFGEALKLLAQRADITLNDRLEKAGFADSDQEKRSKIFEMNAIAARYYSYILKSHSAAFDAREYLFKKRSLPEGISEKFLLGYAPQGWDSLVEYLNKKGYKNEEIVMAGLGVATARGAIDRFRGRIMFPIQNTLGKIVGFSGRLLGVSPTEKTGAKYVNTPETLVYHKRESLYGFAISKDAVRKQNAVIVVEGEFDFLTPFSKGIENIVAIKGSAFTSEQLKLLRRYCDRLILALDNDQAGQDALRRSIIEAAPYNFEIYVCEMPGGKDPDDAAREHFVELKNSIANPTPVFDYLFNSLEKDMDPKDAYSKKKFAEQMSEFLLLVDNPIIKTHYVQKIAEKIATSKDAIEEIIASIRKKKSKVSRKVETEDTDKSADSSKTIVQKELMTGLFKLNDKDVADKIKELLTGEELDAIPYRAIYKTWVEQSKKSLPVEIASLIRAIPLELQDKAEELFLMSSLSGSTERKHEVKDVYRLALVIKKHFALAMLKGDSDIEVDDESLSRANELLKSVEKELQTL